MQKFYGGKFYGIFVVLVLVISSGAFSNDLEDITEHYAQTKLNRCLEAFAGSGMEDTCNVYK